MPTTRELLYRIGGMNYVTPDFRILYHANEQEGMEVLSNNFTMGQIPVHENTHGLINFSRTFSEPNDKIIRRIVIYISIH